MANVCKANVVGMFKGLGYTESRLEKCLEAVSEKLGVGPAEACVKLVEAVRVHIHECKQKAKKHGMELRDYQSAMVDHMITHRGAIAAFQTGTGKTLTAVMVISCCLLLAEIAGVPNTPVNIITPVSLQDNMKKEMKAIGLKPTDKRFNFYSFASFQRQAAVGGKIKSKNAIFVIDEAHELRKDFRQLFGTFYFGDAPEGTQAESVLKLASQGWKTLVMTATPMYAHTYDIANLFALAKGEEEPSSSLRDDMASVEAAKEKLSNLIMFKEPDPKYFPKVIEHEEYITMDMDYFKKYMRIELKEGRGKEESRDRDAFFSKLRILAGKIQPSPKFKFVEKILEKKEPTIVFMEFVHNIDQFVTLADRMGVTYGIVSGKTAKADRQKIVNDYNKGVFQVLVLTKAGGAGLDTKGTQHVILLEKTWTRASDLQVIGRGSRFKSHAHLPPEKQVVHVWHVLVTKPPIATIQGWINTSQVPRYYLTDKPSAEVALYLRANKIYQEEILKAYDILRKVQIKY